MKYITGLKLLAQYPYGCISYAEYENSVKKITHKVDAATV